MTEQSLDIDSETARLNFVLEPFGVQAVIEERRPFFVLLRLVPSEYLLLSAAGSTPGKCMDSLYRRMHREGLCFIRDIDSETLGSYRMDIPEFHSAKELKMKIDLGCDISPKLLKTLRRRKDTQTIHRV